MQAPSSRNALVKSRLQRRRVLRPVLKHGRSKLRPYRVSALSECSYNTTALAAELVARFPGHPRHIAQYDKGEHEQHRAESSQ